jgi:lipopolysaccharide export LptBFGC system permease protein LptF
VASTGVEYYRQELERRRDHLRNEWVWHGPLLLACFMLIAIVAGRAYPGMSRLWSVLPLIVVLLAWTVFGFVRRLRLAKALQAEIDELAGK